MRGMRLHMRWTLADNLKHSGLECIDIIIALENQLSFAFWGEMNFRQGR